MKDFWILLLGAFLVLAGILATRYVRGDFAQSISNSV